MILPASRILLVISKSSCDGSASPEGWLWTKITEAAFCFKASAKISRGWTNSVAAKIVQALAESIPLIFIKSSYFNFKSRFLEYFLKICFANSKTFFPSLSVLKRIAKSSSPQRRINSLWGRQVRYGAGRRNR